MSLSLGLVSVFPLGLVFLGCGFPEHAAVEGCKLVRSAGVPLPSQYSCLNSSQDGPLEKSVRRRFGSIDCRLLVWVTAQSKKNEPGVNCQLSDQYRMKIIHTVAKVKRLQPSACTIDDFSKAFPKDCSSDRASLGNSASCLGRQNTGSVDVLEKHSGHSKRPCNSKKKKKNQRTVKCQNAQNCAHLTPSPDDRWWDHGDSTVELDSRLFQ